MDDFIYGNSDEWVIKSSSKSIKYDEEILCGCVNKLNQMAYAVSFIKYKYKLGKWFKYDTNYITFIFDC